jgi:DNA-binding transcriptional MerR regulator
MTKRCLLFAICPRPADRLDSDKAIGPKRLELLHLFDVIAHQAAETAKNAAGYRLYSEKDLERPKADYRPQVSGTSIEANQGMLLDRKALDLPDALRLQRAVLEKKRRLVDRAIGAIQDAESEIRCGQLVAKKQRGQGFTMGGAELVAVSRLAKTVQFRVAFPTR